jgi:alpha-tubulin suppressor-like RCC1 family protein
MGDRENRPKPHAVKDIRSKIVTVAAGSKHSFFLSSTLIVELSSHSLLDHGEVYVCGKGRDGQLGVKDNEDRRWPIVIEHLAGKPVVQAAAGESTFACV